MSMQFTSSAHAAPAPQAALASQFWMKRVADESSPRGASHAVGSTLHFAQDQEIYGEGDNAIAYFKVISGVVRTCKFLNDGRRQIDAFYLPGDLFGIELGAAHGLSAEAVCDCTIVSYRRTGSAPLVSSDQPVSQQFFSYAMRSLARAQEHSLLLGRRSAVEKVAAFLVDWAEHSADGRIAALAMTRQDMADYLGLTIETVSRTLSQLERDGLIALPTARQIRLNSVARLREMNA